MMTFSLDCFRITLKMMRRMHERTGGKALAVQQKTSEGSAPVMPIL